MAEANRNIFKPPIFTDNRRNLTARLIHFVSLLFITSGLFGLVILPFFGMAGSRAMPVALGIVLLALASFGILRARYVELSAYVLVFGSWILTGIAIFQLGTINSPVTAFFLLVIVSAVLLINVQSAVVTTLASILLVFGFGLVERSGALAQVVLPQPAAWLLASFVMILMLLIVARAVIQQRQLLASSEENEHKLAQLNYELTEQVDSLTRRVSERTTEVSQYLLYMQTSMELSHLINAYPEPARLMEETVELLQKRFGLYYTGIFLVEQTGQWAILRAGTGEIGKAMLARHHQIEVGSGMIGWSIANSRARVAADVGADAVRLATSELPYTRSEAAIPMHSLGKVTGAITVQSIKPDAFSQELVSVLQSYADTLAAVLENIGLNAEQVAHQALDQRTRQADEQSAWFSTFGGRGTKGILYDRISITPLNEAGTAEVDRARKIGQTIQINRAGSPTALVPVKVRDHVIGILSFRKPPDADEWSDREIELLELLSAQLGEAMDNARLYQSIQRQAEREQMVGELTARMRETLDVDTVLRTAANEIFQALALEEVTVELAEGEPILAGRVEQ